MASVRTNTDWIEALRTPGPAQEAALEDLHAILLHRLPYALTRWLQPDDPRLEPFAEEVAQETLLKVLDRLDTFEGRSQFLTWVYKISVRVALSELRRKRWENTSLEALLENEDTPGLARLATDSEPNPAAVVEGADLIARVQTIIDDELTEKQRQALVSIAIQGLPVDEVARQMGTNRNALYKMLHDTRQRLRRRLAREGLSPAEILAALEGRS